MSFAAPQRIIAEGDIVILYISINNMHAIEVKKQIMNKHGILVEYTHQTTYGALKVENLIGKEYGGKVELSRGYAYVLQPNPELWTNNLPHRTQILYTPDISMILLQLEAKPGSIIIEAGTGSGSLSHYFLRAIKETGHLYTFDFHESRVEQAKEEFKKHGLGDFVTVQHRDVCSDGFTEELTGVADAVFLDLPAPYLAIGHVVKALKLNGGRFCGFSPCIEQTQATCVELEKNGFLEIQTMEIIQSEHIVKDKHIPVIDLEFVKTKREDDILQTAKDQKKQPGKTKKVLTTIPPPMQPGHSGYLTFATLPPLSMR
ncbi:CLUMA_CG001328, isoform A [Clunio marinus]|uniref:tRNA (adenine(58)-N(1))-methyltransferase catalytic subunit TRMT61A n=1 Tax=Clunio marinus TaxID=568069 RepID=A0A1J1HHM2_9DIPT|nr:CLUMA_CG001328, isoform A [Clunio marinus]